MEHCVSALLFFQPITSEDSNAAGVRLRARFGGTDKSAEEGGRKRKKRKRRRRA